MARFIQSCQVLGSSVGNVVRLPPVTTSLMLPPTSPASPVALKRDLMLDRLSNDQLLAIPTLDAAIVASSHHLRVISEAVRSQLVFVAWQ